MPIERRVDAGAWIADQVEVKQVTWRKGRSTRYKHLYDGSKAVCGSKTKPAGQWWEHVARAPKCPKCLKKEAEVEHGKEKQYD